MFFSLLSGMFGWMPQPIGTLVTAVFVIFSIFVAIALLKAIYNLLKFVFDLLGGLVGKVVGLFV